MNKKFISSKAIISVLFFFMVLVLISCEKDNQDHENLREVEIGTENVSVNEELISASVVTDVSLLDNPEFNISFKLINQIGQFSHNIFISNIPLVEGVYQLNEYLEEDQLDPKIHFYNYDDDAIFGTYDLERDYDNTVEITCLSEDYSSLKLKFESKFTKTGFIDRFESSVLVSKKEFIVMLNAE